MLPGHLFPCLAFGLPTWANIISLSLSWICPSLPVKPRLFPCLHFWQSLKALFTASQPMAWQIGSNHFLVGTNRRPMGWYHISALSHEEPDSLAPLSLYVNMLGMCCISVFLVNAQRNPSVNSLVCWGTQEGRRRDRDTAHSSVWLLFLCSFKRMSPKLLWPSPAAVDRKDFVLLMIWYMSRNTNSSQYKHTIQL